MDLYFTNIQPFLDFPIVEQEIEQKRKNTQQNRVNFIGGITMSKGKVPSLNPDTKQIFESAKDGVVLLSFGSAVEMDDSDERAVSVKNIVVDVFKQYPQMNLIIKWGKRTSSGTVEQYNKLSENVYAKSWLEQTAILGGGLKLFITHGGQNSINEAVKFSVPIILFPFFGDQYNNAEALAARGVSKVLEIRSKTLNNELTEALHEIFNKYSEYKAGMDELSKKMNSVEPAKEFVEKFRQLRKSL
uniref:UDP-glucuronosyltransferase n=1 Tax=Globodera rostochiensis TaxID=31243 RepID=A0A914HK83_GLORO